MYEDPTPTSIDNEAYEDVKTLLEFMRGPDHPTFVRMIAYFSNTSVSGDKYLPAREVMQFRNSLSDEEWIDFKVEFWDQVTQDRYDSLR